MLLFYWPTFINFSATHILSGRHFPPKINNDFCLAFYINPTSMPTSDPDSLESLHRCTLYSQHFHKFRKCSLYGGVEKVKLSQKSRCHPPFSCLGLNNLCKQLTPVRHERKDDIQELPWSLRSRQTLVLGKGAKGNSCPKNKNTWKIDSNFVDSYATYFFISWKSICKFKMLNV